MSSLPLCRSDSLSLPDRDPLDLSIGGGAGYGVVVTKQEVVVTKNCQRVSSFTPGYEPCATAFAPSENEVAIGGKVGGWVGGGWIGGWMSKGWMTGED